MIFILAISNKLFVTALIESFYWIDCSNDKIASSKFSKFVNKFAKVNFVWLELSLFGSKLLSRIGHFRLDS